MREGIPYVRSRRTYGRQREWTRNRLHDHARQAAELGAQLRLDHELGLDPTRLGRLSAVHDPPDEPPPDEAADDSLDGDPADDPPDGEPPPEPG